MLRSMYSGVAGLKTHQTKMDVIGNNIANVNTTAYKSQSITFSDLMYQTTQSASGSTATTGGVNAKQIGLGSKSAAIATAIDTQGATETTNDPFDLMISGSAFFVVNDGTQNLYTRDGSFYVDGSGNLAMRSTGYYVYGWTAQTDSTTGVTSINKNAGVGKLQIMSAANMTYPPEGTTEAVLTGNIDAADTNVTSTAGKTVTLEFYDNLGYLYTAEFTLKNVTDSSNKYTFALTDILDSSGKSVGTDQLSKINLGSSVSIPSGYSISSSSATGPYTITNGTTSYTNVQASGSVSDLAANLRSLYGISDSTLDSYQYTLSGDGKITVYDPSASPTKSVTLTYDVSTGAISSPTTKICMDFTNDVDTKQSAFIDVSIDLSTTTNVSTSGSCTLSASKGDSENNNTGRKMGTMTGVTISTDGKINASYSNGQTRLLGQVAVAEFANASGLEKEGDNLYSSTLNSGDATLQDVTEDGGSISTGVLEMSNVDLSQEFTNMITAQRGFQANSRIITVSDTLLEELTNLKR